MFTKTGKNGQKQAGADLSQGILNEQFAYQLYELSGELLYDL